MAAVTMGRSRVERADALGRAAADLRYAAGQLEQAAELERKGLPLQLVEICVNEACEGLDRACGVVCPDAPEEG